MSQGIKVQGIKEKTDKINKLKERTFIFSTKAIDLISVLPKNASNDIIGKQFLRSATSIGANYREADGADSKKDLKYKMILIRKEAKETYYWLGLLEHSNKRGSSELMQQIKWLISESKELVLIFSKIVINLTP